MLYHILYEFLYPLNHLWAPLRVLNVFQYITFRTAYASLTALLISLLLGPWLITRLREFQIGQQIREEGPKSHQKKLTVPFCHTFAPDLLVDSLFTSRFWFFGYLPFLFVIWMVIVGCSNTVNLTDGLDGLAIGCTLIASAALTALTYVTSNAILSDYLDLQYIRQAGELTIFCGSMVGASLGFLWYNAHPAEVFMGDVGSLALGGAIGTVAVIIKQELLLIFIGGVFVAEGLSVIIQVASFKLRGKRVFKMAPLHQHFELQGWSESKVIIRFWIASLILSLFSLSTLKLR